MESFLTNRNLFRIHYDVRPGIHRSVLFRIIFSYFQISIFRKMSHLCRLVPRTATNILYVSRMNAHNLPPGTPVKVPEAKGGHHIVSGSGQFIATDGPSGTKSGIGGGSSASTLPGSQTAHDHTNPTKTTGDSKQSHSKDPSDKAYEQKHSRINRNSSSSSFFFI
jgi:hypothetical protein